MTNADYPWDLTCHVRDPKVWKQDDTYYMVQGARTKEDKGVVLVFSSEDKEHWEMHSPPAVRRNIWIHVGMPGSL